MSKRLKKSEASKLAAEILAHAVSEGKNPAAVALGRLGGLKGGKARAQRLTAKQRKEIARHAAVARWSSERDEE